MKKNFILTLMVLACFLFFPTDASAQNRIYGYPGKPRVQNGTRKSAKAPRSYFGIKPGIGAEMIQSDVLGNSGNSSVASPAISLTLGRGEESSMSRMEIEYMYHFKTSSEFSEEINNGFGTDTYTTSMDLTMHTLMVNFFVDFGNYLIYPYVGGGVGGSYATTSFTYSEPSTGWSSSASKTGLYPTVQGMLGFSISLGRKMSFETQAKYFHVFSTEKTLTSVDYVGGFVGLRFYY